MSKENPTKAERIAAAKERAQRAHEQHRPQPGPQPDDEPLPWLEGPIEPEDE